MPPEENLWALESLISALHPGFCALIRHDNWSVAAIWRPALRALTLLMPVLLYSANPQITIEDTGSTNRAGCRVTFDQDGHASVEQRRGDIRKIQLSPSLCSRFMSDLKRLGGVSAIPARHCMKSVSFGSRLFIESEGDRSPDLSCPGQSDPRIDALQKDAQEILQASREAAGIRSGKMVTVPAPTPPKQ